MFTFKVTNSLLNVRKYTTARLEVLTTVLLEIDVYQYVAPCQVVKSCHGSKGSQCLYFQGDEVLDPDYNHQNVSNVLPVDMA